MLISVHIKKFSASVKVINIVESRQEMFFTVERLGSLTRRLVRDKLNLKIVMKFLVEYSLRFYFKP